MDSQWNWEAEAPLAVTSCDTRFLRMFANDLERKCASGVDCRMLLLNAIETMRRRARAVEVMRNTRTRAKKNRERMLRQVPDRVRNRVLAVFALVADYYGMPTAAVVGHSRVTACARPRHVAFWACRKALTDLCGSHIAMVMGRDHTTVLHAVNKIDDKRYTSPDWKAETDIILARVKTQDASFAETP